MRFAVVALALVASSIPAAAPAGDWAQEAGDGQFARSAAICRKAESTPLPPGDAAGGPAPAGCNSSDLLYGIGRPADPATARACALREMARGDNTTGGAATLATIYANGRGVPRDDDVAIAYACRIEGAAFEMDGRVTHLAERKAEGGGAKPFDLCDDATSGLLGGFCAERDGARADAKRDAAVAQLTAGLNAAGQAAFARLRTAEDAFVRAAADGEVDMSGTGRGALVIASERANRDSFLATLRAVLAGKIAGAPPAREADRQLNATYAKVVAMGEPGGPGSTVTTDGIRDAQRAWLRYRDAFLAFAAAATPTTSQAALAADLTRARLKNLEAFLAP